MTGYPLLLDLAGKRVLVVGAGAVAARRLPALVEAGAAVEVVSPVMSAAVEALPVVRHRRAFAPADVVGAWLVHACTDEPAVNAAVAGAAAAERVFCVRADDAAGSNAWVPAVHRGPDSVVAVNAGGDPRRAVELRNAVAAALDAGTLPLRPRRRRGGIGTVALVGGGPGDPGLLTVRGRRLLAAADVVVVDRLAPRELLATLDPDVEVVEAGKVPYCAGVSQDDINALLVTRARSGARVVRLKGGDPFVFGRGGEEALACLAAGVPVEVVPGVSSAFAVPAYAGIPVTHRGVAQDVTVVAAHGDPTAVGSTVNWDALAAGSGTLVLMMGLRSLADTAAELVRRGRSAGTPVAVVSCGTTAAQRVVVADLAGIAAAVRAAGLSAPAVTVVGEVVRLREVLARVG